MADDTVVADLETHHIQVLEKGQGADKVEQA